jgi:glutathione synthase/RimK-type ligase-like ATP-grasp enzyme
MRIAFLAPAPDYPEDWDWAFEPQSRPLVAKGAAVDAIRWTDSEDLRGYDLILSLCAWGYHLRYEEWLSFLQRMESEDLPLVNPPQLLRWNSDKAYLQELGGLGLPTVPTLSVDHLNEAALAAAYGVLGCEEVVVKPPVSAGASGTYRLCQGEGAHVPTDVHGQRMMVQPFLPSITEKGEYSLILFDGVLSHAVVKRPKQGDFRVQPHLGGTTVRCDPPSGSEALAKAALDAAPAHATYARIDMVEGADGGLMIMEMELVEPALFLAEAPEGTDAFVNAVFSAAQRARE